MLSRLFRQSGKCTLGIRGTYLGVFNKDWKMLRDSELQDRSHVKDFLDRKIHKITSRTQRGLFHGKEPKSGNRYVFSDKHQRHPVRVNAHKKLYHSDVLNRDLDILTSTKAMKTIRKYGGIDSYLLLNKETKMKSLYGEYLRELLLRSLNDPSFKVDEVLRENRFLVHFKYKGKKMHKFRNKLDGYMWIPPEIRHTDLSAQYDVEEEEIPLKDRRKYEELKFKIMNKEDINFDDPFLKNLREEHEARNNNPEALQAIKAEAKQNYNKIFKSRYLKRRFAEHLREAKEFQSKHPTEIY